MNTKSPITPGRLHEIDGIRGWAALMVLMFHLCLELFGAVFPVFRHPALNFLLNGHLAVFIFFVLSGDALSSGFVSSRNPRSLARLALKRYFRLAGPIFLSCLTVYLLLKLGLTFHVEASVLVDTKNWLGRFLPFEPDFKSMAKYSLLWVFTGHTSATSYNPFLWPMSIELYGSFFVFALLFSLAHLRRPLLAVFVAFGFFWILGSYFALFFFGLALALLREAGFFDKLRSKNNLVICLIGLLLIAVADTVLTQIHLRGPTSFIPLACGIVFLIYSNATLVSFFSNRLSRYLGRISFPLYISHFAVIVSFTSWAIVYAHSQGPIGWRQACWIIISSVVLCLLMAEVFARIEQVYLKLLDRWTTRILKPPSMQ